MQTHIKHQHLILTMVEMAQVGATPSDINVLFYVDLTITTVLAHMIDGLNEEEETIYYI